MLAKSKRTGEYFAMKRLKKADIMKLRQVDHVISENSILAEIEHPFLVSAPDSNAIGWSGWIRSGFPLPLLPYALHRWW